MPVLYITDNLLRVERVLPLAEAAYCPATEDGIASINYSEAALTVLNSNRMKFIVELELGATPPTTVRLLPHPDNAARGTNWYVPTYWKADTAFYDVEFKTQQSEGYEYQTRLSAKKFDQLRLESTNKIVRVFSEHGLTQEFLTKYGLRLMKKGKFVYAAPMKKPTK